MEELRPEAITLILGIASVWGLMFIVLVFAARVIDLTDAFVEWINDQAVGDWLDRIQGTFR